MAMNPAGLRRNFKNIVHNFSDAQVKVREATSNDPWGPSSTLMSEIADLTYNVVAFSEIMQMIWKRLNDHGKNWRHVYKALVLLEYLIKTGTEKVAQQCKENIFAIQTLKDFQYIEENKDQGMNVREKAKQLVSLLKDDERLKNERARALKAKERFAQATSGIGSDATIPPFSHRPDSFSTNEAGSPQGPGKEIKHLESARPQTAGEEELQLQLALAMSKEEAEQEEQRRRSDDVRLAMAITQSQEDFRGVQSPGHTSTGGFPGESRGSPSRIRDQEQSKLPQSALLDLLDINVAGTTSNLNTASSNPATITDPWGVPLQQRPQTADPWNSSMDGRMSTSPLPQDPWAPKPPSRSGTPSVSITTPTRATQSAPTINPNEQTDPWNGATPSSALPPSDPWGGSTAAVGSSAFGSTPSLATNGDVDGFDALSSRAVPSKSTNNLHLLGGSVTPNPFDMSAMQNNFPRDQLVKKTPESFLGENSALVNLDALVSSKQLDPLGGMTNPFASVPPASNASPTPVAPNPFQLQQQQQQQRVSINQLRSQQQFAVSPIGMGYPTNSGIPAGGNAVGGAPMANNPFL